MIWWTYLNGPIDTQYSSDGKNNCPDDFRGKEVLPTLEDVRETMEGCRLAVLDSGFFHDSLLKMANSLIMNFDRAQNLTWQDFRTGSSPLWRKFFKWFVKTDTAPILVPRFCKKLGVLFEANLSFSPKVYNPPRLRYCNIALVLLTTSSYQGRLRH